MVGIFVAAVLAAIMSTIDSLLVVASSAVTRDVYQQTLHPERAGDTLTGLSRRATLTLAVVALAIAMAVATLVNQKIRTSRSRPCISGSSLLVQLYNKNHFNVEKKLRKYFFHWS